MVSKPGGAPKLKTKAAEGRRLLPCIVWFLENIFEQETPHQQLRYRCAKQLQLMYDCLTAIPWDPKACASHGRKHVQLWSELGQLSIESSVWQGKGWLLWRWYPKHHLFLHTVEDQLAFVGTPREVWCYYDESEIGQAVKLAESLHASALHKTIIAKHRC